ncbi:MAG: sigma-54 dependent transcriptional regulator [Thermoanaerobaculia bacterium]
MGSPRVLLVDDQADLRHGLRLLVEPVAAEVREAGSGEEALELLRRWTPHVMLTDIAMGAVSGMDLLGHVRQHHPEIKVVMITGFGTIELAVEAMQRGAENFLCKPFDNQDVRAEVERLGREALVTERMRQGNARRPRGSRPIVAESRQMAQVLELVAQVAPTEMPVLIQGETGTGKELIARAVHEQSRASTLPFLPVNSSALPDTLLEAELFGHVKGAFTGADRSREGIFSQARGGTVFLDEVALMSLAFQGKLLRVLQEHTVTPLGSAAPKPVAFRLVAATNRSLRERVAAGEFREDLYYRLRVVTIKVPPLRERPDDVIPLALHFLARYAEKLGLSAEKRPSLTTSALRALEAHRWPGNVRELESGIQRALILCRGENISAHHLRLDEVSHPWSREIPESLSYETGKARVLETYQRRVVERALRTASGNVSRAAESCSLTRAAFQRLMRQLGLERQDFRPAGP